MTVVNFPGANDSASTKTLREVVLNPETTVGIIAFGGTPLAFIRLSHPRHGDVDYLLPKEAVGNLAKAFASAEQELTP